MKLKDKLEELERRVRELEARPQFVPVYWPVFQPVQPVPVWPMPQYVPPIVPSCQPWQSPFTVTCGSGSGYTTNLSETLVKCLS